MNSKKFDRLKKLRKEFKQVDIQSYEDWTKVDTWFSKATPTIQSEWTKYLLEFKKLIEKSRFWTYKYNNYKAVTMSQRSEKFPKLKQAPERDAQEEHTAKQEILDLFDGILRLSEIPEFELNKTKPVKDLRKVFIVHGHDNAVKQEVARFVEKIELEAIILHEQSSGGRTIIEKLEHYTDVDFALVLLTPDDIGAVKTDRENLKFRARQNVILELGYMMAKLGRQNVCALLKESVEKPTDYDGVVYIQMDNQGAWKQALVIELKVANINGNIEKLYS